MKERPILFSSEMVRAVLDGRKSQTRRVVSDSNSFGNFKATELDLTRAWVDGKKIKSYLHPEVADRLGYERDDIVERLYPGIAPAHEWDQEPDKADGYTPPASRLWVREKWTAWATVGAGDLLRVEYAAGGYKDLHLEGEWTLPKSVESGGFAPSIFMPRWASRITLEVTGLRVERLQGISEADAVAEGCDGAHFENPDDDYAPSDAYRRLWDSLNAKRGYGWDNNPWVWVIEFRKLSDEERRAAA